MLLNKDKLTTAFLVHIQSDEGELLFRSYRDYLVFINLVREFSQYHQHQIYGFTWLPEKALLLCRAEGRLFMKHLLLLMKRHFYWLQQGKRRSNHYQLQILPLSTEAEQLDALRFIHHQARLSGQVKDALDYHWHSYPIYHDFWQLNWLATVPILNCFSTNQLLALNHFSQYMQQATEHNFQQRLRCEDYTNTLLEISHLAEPNPPPRLISMPLTAYHKGLHQKTELVIENPHRGAVTLSLASTN